MIVEKPDGIRRHFQNIRNAFAAVLYLQRFLLVTRSLQVACTHVWQMTVESTSFAKYPSASAFTLKESRRRKSRQPIFNIETQRVIDTDIRRGI